MTSAVEAYRRISIRGVTCVDSATEEHTIRVFAQVEGAERQAIATQGDQSVGFSSRQDACGEGCKAACERAAAGADALAALDDCRQLCETACRRPDTNGKFSSSSTSDVCEVGWGGGETWGGAGGGGAAGVAALVPPTTRALGFRGDLGAPWGSAPENGDTGTQRGAGFAGLRGWPGAQRRD